jgi:putative MATE family efflux protein
MGLDNNIKDEKENKMGTMPIGKLLLVMSLPMIISMLVQAMYNVVDSVFVSRFDQDALTAVSTVFPLQNLMIGVASGLGVGLNALISKALGEKKRDRANEIARQGIFLEAIGFIIFLLIGLFGVRAFMLSQTTDEKIIEYGTAYGSVVCACSIGMFVQMTFERLLQSTGKTIYSMITQGVGAIINIILDPILIFGYLGMPRMGAKGAAVATVIGQCIAGVLALYFNVKKNEDVKVSFKNFRPDTHIINKILSIGVPSVIMVAIGSIMTYLLNKILFSFTSIAVAVFGSYFKIQSMAFMPVFGLNNGMVPIVSYNYGARKPDRMIMTIKRGMITACCIMIFCLIIMQCFPEQILRIFDAKDEMMAMGVPAIRILSTAFIFAGYSVVCSGMFQALGKGVYSMIISFARQLVVLIPVAYLMAKITNDVNFVWLAFPIAEIMSVCVSTILLVRTYKTIIKPLYA